MALKKLRVLPNPYLHLDHEGRPAGAFPREPDLVNGDTGLFYVGATRTSTETQKEDPRRGLPAVHDYTWTFDSEPTEVPNTEYYRRAIRFGELLAADLETWRASGGNADAFVPAATRLAHAKAGAVAHHEREYGETPLAAASHWAEFHAIAAKAAATPPPGLAKTKPAAASEKE